MLQLIDRLAELTGFRDRHQLDVSIVHAVNDLMRPSRVGIYRTVGEGDDRRWLTGAHMQLGDATPTADPFRDDVETLPVLDVESARAACLRSAQPVIVDGAPQTSHFPICTEHQVIGVLELQTADAMTTVDRATVTTLMRIFGNYHALLDHSERDPLTGLLNRQSFGADFMTRVRQPVPEPAAAVDRRERPQGGAQWLGMVDIDFFKRVNDGFGHPIGDEVLLLLSRLLRSTFRHFDRLYRFGGEEFVVVLGCTNAGQAAGAFERLRVNVQSFRFPQVGRVTISTGFTEMCRLDTPAGALARADKALYHAKQNGRNQVAEFESLVASGQLVATDIVGDIELF